MAGMQDWGASSHVGWDVAKPQLTDWALLTEASPLLPPIYFS